MTVSANRIFPLPLRGDFIGNCQWKLFESFMYDNFPVLIEVPKGFVSDGASIPKFAWILIGSPWSDVYGKAAVIHDWGYHTQTRTRKQVDKIFLEGMKILGVGWWKRGTMYNCVRCFSWICWNKKKK